MPTGPSLEQLLRRLVETPPDFLDPPLLRGSGTVHVAAVVGDALALREASPSPTVLAAFAGQDSKFGANELSLAAVAAWLVADDLWQDYPATSALWVELFLGVVPTLATEAKAARYVYEADRREEFARTVIARLGLVPAGESESVAADRLASLSSVERRRLLEASRAAEARARAIREALAKKAAEESADKWTRE